MDVKEIIREGESETVEFKEGLNIREILETVCAFANSKGGVIIIGVSDDGAIRGINIGKGTVESIVNSITNEIRPKIYPEVSVLFVDGKGIIKVVVPEGDKKPYFYKERAYKRVGKSNVKMDPEEITRKIIEREKIWEFVERRITGRFEDLDLQKVKEFMRRMLIVRKTKFVGDEKELLKKLNVLEDGKVNLAGILLFGKNPQEKMPYACIKAMRKIGNEITDEELIEGRLDEQIEGALDFVRRHIPKEIRIEKSKRIEEWIVPEEIIREIIVNAVVHRDYSIPSPILLKYVDDEIVIINPGGLLPPLKVEDLYRKDHPSILRNPIIGRALFLLGYIEGWGEGTTRIIEICKDKGIPIPKFEDRDGFFYVKIKVYREELDEREKEVLKMAHRGVTSRQISKKLGISERTAREILRKLYERGILKRRREGRGYIYYV